MLDCGVKIVAESVPGVAERISDELIWLVSLAVLVGVASEAALVAFAVCAVVDAVNVGRLVGAEEAEFVSVALTEAVPDVELGIVDPVAVEPDCDAVLESVEELVFESVPMLAELVGVVVGVIVPEPETVGVEVMEPGSELVGVEETGPVPENETVEDGDVSVPVALALTLETKLLRADVTSEESEDVGVAETCADVMTEFAELTSDAIEDATDAAEDKAEETDATSEAVEATDSSELAKDKMDVAASLADESTELADAVIEANEAVSVLVGVEESVGKAELVGANESLGGSVLLALGKAELVGAKESLGGSVLVGAELSLLKIELSPRVIPSSSDELELELESSDELEVEVGGGVMDAAGSELVGNAVIEGTVELGAGADTGPVAGSDDGVTLASVLAGVSAELLEAVSGVEEELPSIEATPDNSLPTDERRLPTPESVELELVMSLLVSVVVAFVTCLFTALGK
ncbi:hypothetical protein LTR10_019821 [Elasticomyces elasticus]|uniref:Uncharacterized protein n=1 Tax=Exophiala sideris TaxID=1016849 RepID=A0ABR0J176_9EURO|nr:hypothetical protein LTR10_019821 [Elasticomyces elasticus]KAK5024405.1 hypothetical protein LTS07_008696 [Exophiala sideris]KAK5054138.1 hypothetical protein LTR69_009100 [Exophiala sideris]